MVVCELKSNKLTEQFTNALHDEQGDSVSIQHSRWCRSATLESSLDTMIKTTTTHSELIRSFNFFCDRTVWRKVSRTGFAVYTLSIRKPCLHR